MPSDMDARVRERRAAALRAIPGPFLLPFKAADAIAASDRAADVAERIAMARALLEGSGFVVVPREASETMHEAGHMASLLYPETVTADWIEVNEKIWRAMIDAAERSASGVDADTAAATRDAGGAVGT